MKIFKKLIFIFILLFLFSYNVFAADILQDRQEILKAKVVLIEKEGKREITGTGIIGETQKIKAQILQGVDSGSVITFENDFIQLKKDQKFYLLRTIRVDDPLPLYAVSDIDRMPWIIFFVILFVLLTIIFGGIQGLRGLLSLGGGMLLIFYILLPQIIAGTSPLLISCIVASLIVIVGSYITHGFNRTTSSAIVGMIITVVLTGLLSYFAVHVSTLSGMDNEEAMYLALNSHGTINLQGLLLGGIIIGLLGVLYDSAIGQAISVEELWRVDKNLSKKYVFKRALRIGREHIGALVNTLAIAYVGAALPLLVLFSFPTEGSPLLLVNRELFATEIIRALIGSIGLVLAVPITTFISVWMLHGIEFKGSKKEMHSHTH